MKIGIVDVDGHNGFPNLALMKISAYHKQRGHEVSFADPLGHYDKVYMSKVFTFTPDCPYTWDCEIEKGGTGYGDYKKVLPEEIEHICPDYSLYGTDYAVGFTTRGCIRHCSFCLVHDKEGMIHEHADVREFLGNQKKVVLLDNNIVAHKHGIKQLEYLRDNHIPVDCNQGMDARIICKSDYLCKLVADLTPYGTRGIRIACDQANEIEPCHKVIQRVHEINPRIIFIVYCILTEDKEDSLNRVMQWRKYGHKVAVYAPPYRNFNDPNQIIPKWQKNLSRWASNHFIYYSTEWEDYKKSKNRYEQEETLF